MEYGVEVELKSDFLVVKETLERIGICNRRTRVITPSAYILHKRGRYYVIHFKCLLAMDGFRKSYDEKDLGRQDAIASMLENWGMVRVVDRSRYQEPLAERIFVLPHAEKRRYRVNHKYRMGNDRR
jgi:hypothetical protein